jgi:hypothetical protein
MTLSPVFRSDEAVQVLRTAGVWSRLDPAARGQAEAIASVKQDLPNVLDAEIHRHQSARRRRGDNIGIEFVQEFFFLILFGRSSRPSASPQPICSCAASCFIKGTITAADDAPVRPSGQGAAPLRAKGGVRGSGQSSVCWHSSASRAARSSGAYAPARFPRHRPPSSSRSCCRGWPRSDRSKGAKRAASTA